MVLNKLNKNTLLNFINIDEILKIVLMLIMFSVGLALKIKDFKYITKNWYLLLTGLFAKIIILPIIGILVVELFQIADIFKLGIFILLICPGGTTSNVITYWFDGTSALTIFLTILSSLISILTIPIAINFASDYYLNAANEISLPVLDTIINIIAIIIIPSFLGVLFNHYYQHKSKIIEKFLKPFSVILLAIVFSIKFFASKESGGTEISMSEITQMLPILLIINIAGILFGFLFARFFNINNRDSMTIGVELGLQNVGLALLVGGVIIGNQELIKPALIYALFTFWSTSLFAFVIKKMFYEKNWY